MLRNLLITGTVAALSIVATPARADHDHEIGYLLGGALIGAAIGELAYRSHSSHGHHYVSTRHYRYPVSPVRYYAPASGHNRYGHRHSKGRHYVRSYSVRGSHRH